MKLLHFSDTHLGFSEYHKIDAFTGLNQREQDFYNAWDQVIAAILEIKPDVVIHTGDLFHTPRPSNRAIRVAFESIQRISSSGIPFVIISGNHETPRIKSTGSIFESLALFDHVYAAYNSMYQVFRIGQCDFHCVPHCSLTEELEEAFKNVRINADARYNVFLTHGAWTGKQSYSMGEFNEQRVPDVEAALGVKFDYIALGHYHKKLDVKPNAVYCGSTERTSLNESAQTCGFMLVDLASGDKEYKQITTRTMMKLPVINCAGMKSQDIYSKLQQLAGPEIDNAIVQLALENIDESTFFKLETIELDRIFEKAFYLHKTISRTTTENNADSGPGIGSLSIEFEKFIAALGEGELDKNRLKQTGLLYLEQAG